jgi:glucose/arabinose dehydrogenase
MADIQRMRRISVAGWGWALMVCAGRLCAADPDVELKLWAEGFTSPVALEQLPGTQDRFVVVDQIGVAFVVSGSGVVESRPFLDLRHRMVALNQGFDERGFLGLAFHPQFSQNRKLYVYYSAPRGPATPEGWDHTSHISEFTVVEDDPNRVDPSSERVIMTIDQPFFNHNGGCLVFGPDDYLYIGTGDGGKANDEGLRPEHGNGQELMTLLGEILRIDVNHGAPFAIPPDNPFPDGADGRPEIFAWGLRNPWRFSFDRGDEHALFAGDVGQGLFEEVDIIVKGGNYGWRLKEGYQGFDPGSPGRVPDSAPKTDSRGEPLIDPIVAYKNLTGFKDDPEALGISVTGGYIYRGTAIPHLEGKYIFGDWSRAWARPEGVLLVASKVGEGGAFGRWQLAPLRVKSHPEGHVGAYVSSFGQDAAGEIYVLTNGGNTPTGRTGRVWKLVPG